jgi:hypothetical protein
MFVGRPRDNRDVSWGWVCLLAPFCLLAAQSPLPSKKLAPETTAAFDRYIEDAEARIGGAEIRNETLASGEMRIESGGPRHDIKVPGGMIQDWVGSMFIPGATLGEAQAALQDYANYPKYYKPKVIESKELAHAGDDYEVFLRLYEKHMLSVVLNTTYRIRYSRPDVQHLIVTSRSTRIAEVKDPDNSFDEELPVGNDKGFLWRLNSYWRFQSADGGVYARCEAISLSRAVPLGIGWMLNGFLEGFPKQSMMNTLSGARQAIQERSRR